MATQSLPNIATQAPPSCIGVSVPFLQPETGAGGVLIENGSWRSDGLLDFSCV